jgi:hypothetical protein
MSCSEPGQGTAFEIYFPAIEKANDSEKVSPVSPEL